MLNPCGDDLVGARKFMDICQAHMSDIFMGEDQPVTDIVEKLADIQSHAKLMHARAIYKSTQTLIDNFNRRASAEVCVAAVRVLQRQINHYKNGLNEVAHKSIAPTTKAIKGPPIASDFALQQTAANTLRPLVKHAPEAYQGGLLALIATAANDRAEKGSLKEKDFDSLLPQLTNGWLRAARSQGKSISVSVASDNALLELETFKAVYKNLNQIGYHLISVCVEPSQVRSEKGLRQSAHVAITARERAGKLSVMITCDAALQNSKALSSVRDELAEQSISCLLRDEADQTHIEIYNIPCRAILAGQSYKEAAR